MHALILDFNGNPSVGLYGLETSEFLLLGKEVPDVHDAEIEKVFKKPIKRINIAGTGLISVFAVWNNNKLLVPSIIFDNELNDLKELGIDYDVINTELTCLGNNILASEKAVIINPQFTEDERKIIAEALGKPVIKEAVYGIESVGSIGIIRNNKGLFHRDLLDGEIKKLEKLLGIEIMTGTVNMGSPFVKSGIIVGENGFIIGSNSGGPEIANADEALGFINN